MNDAATVQRDDARNRGMLIYFAVMGIGAIVVFVLTVSNDWGYYGWFGGGFMAVVALGGAAGMAKTGGAGKLACPSCGGENEVLHITEHRIMACTHCGVWLEGAEAMTQVPADRMADHNAFDMKLPDGDIQWPEGCPVCRAATTRTIKLEGTSVAGDVAGMVAPVSVQRVSKLEVPACAQHDDGVALRREGADTIIAFRSHAYWQAFKTANQA